MGRLDDCLNVYDYHLNTDHHGLLAVVRADHASFCKSLDVNIVSNIGQITLPHVLYEEKQT